MFTQDENAQNRWGNKNRLEEDRINSSELPSQSQQRKWFCGEEQFEIQPETGGRSTNQWDLMDWILIMVLVNFSSHRRNSYDLSRSLTKLYF